VHYVAWTEGELYWITTSDSRYGYLGPVEPWRKYASESRAKTGAPGSNSDGWVVGDALTTAQGSIRATILAVADKCALIQTDRDRRPWPEPNDHLARFYKKQVKLF